MAGKPVNYRVECKQFFVESKTKVTKKGKPLVQRVEQRKMFIVDHNAVGADSGQYRIFVKNGRFTIAVIPTIPQSIWNNPSGRCEMWYKIPADVEYDDGTVERPYKRTNDPAMDEAGILRWLTFRMGANLARFALAELQEAEPENMKARAEAA